MDRRQFLKRTLGAAGGAVILPRPAFEEEAGVLVKEPLALLEKAEPRPNVRGTPKESDVTMRSLRARPRDENDPHNTLEAMEGFHATWLEWTYSDDADFIRKVHDIGATFGGAAGAGSYDGGEPHEVWNVRNLEGDPVYAGWMRTWAQPNPWGCANHPEFRAGHLRYVENVIDAGADLLQRDEPRQNLLALQWGGCFCDYCMEGFNAWLEKKGDPELLAGLGVTSLDSFDYRDYLRKREAPVGDEFHTWPSDDLKAYFEAFQVHSTLEFHHWWRNELNKHAGRHVPVSCNNGVRRWGDVELVFDYCIGELSAGNATPEFLYDAVKRAASFGKTQSVTMPIRDDDAVTLEWIQHIRQTLAAAYAVASHMEMPWDTYLPTPDADRFFGKPGDYADLSAFVRAMAHYLDGYADAAAWGGRIEDARWSEDRVPVMVMGNSDQIYAFTRVKPGDGAAPVVLHLLDWRADPEPFRLSILPEFFFGDVPLQYRLFTPTHYDKDAHNKAFDSGDYSPLTWETKLDDGYVTTVEIPALAPWGILVVEPAAVVDSGIWQPVIRISEAAAHEHAKLTMESQTAEAEVRYTLDGTEPGPISTLYREPLTIESDTVVKCRAFAHGKSSDVATTKVRKAHDVAPLAPDEPAFAEHLKLWLSADGLSECINDGAPIHCWKSLVGPDAKPPVEPLLDGRMPQQPKFSMTAMNGRPAVRFHREEAMLAISGFANETLAEGEFTVLLLSNSEDPDFGLSGNARNGRGGEPRLYMTREVFRYDVLHPAIEVDAPPNLPSVTAYTHDGKDTARAYMNGAKQGKQTGFPVVESFGGGGHLAMPYWAANEPRQGDISEVVIFNRKLTSKDIERISLYLRQRYKLTRRWVAE